MSSAVTPPTKAVQLISYREDCDPPMRVEAAGAELLQSVTEPLAVVSIVGATRGGKSYIANCLAGDRRVFELGDLVTACTDGVWVYVTDTVVRGARLTLLDFEGMFDTGRANENYDAQLFAIAILVTSLLIYNTNSTLKEDGIKALSVVTHLTTQIQTSVAGSAELAEGEEDDGTTYERLFPHLLVLLRDFFLQLPEGVTCADEYLMHVLRYRPGRTPAVREANEVRSCIRDFFSKLNCRWLVRPVDSDEDLRRVGELPEEALRPKFRTGMDELRRFIMSSVQAKRIHRGADGGTRGSDACVATGPTLTRYLYAIVDAISSGKVLRIPGLWDAASETACAESALNALTAFRSWIDEARSRMPLSHGACEAFVADARAAERQAMDRFNEMATLSGPARERHVNQLVARIADLRQAYLADDMEVSRGRCEEEVERILQHMQQRVDARSFTSLPSLEEEWAAGRADLDGRRDTLGRALEQVLCAAQDRIKAMQATVSVQLQLSKAEQDAAAARREAEERALQSAEEVRKAQDRSKQAEDELQTAVEREQSAQRVRAGVEGVGGAWACGPRQERLNPASLPGAREAAARGGRADASAAGEAREGDGGGSGAP